MPTDPDSGIALGQGSDGLLVGLPAQAASANAESTGQGQVVYEGEQASTVVQATDQGVTIATVIANPVGGEEQFAYDLTLPENGVLEERADGSIAIIDGDDGDIIGTIARPWAKDSAGNLLPTSYAIEGTTVVQKVLTDDAVGAVVADPKIELHWYWPTKARVWFSRRETEKIYRNLYGPASAAAAAGVACGYIPLVPLKVACQVVVVYGIGDFTTNVTQAHNRHKCLTVDVTAFPKPKIDWQDRDGDRCKH